MVVRKRIDHRCSLSTEKSQTEGLPFQWETRLAEFPLEWWAWGLRFTCWHCPQMMDSIYLHLVSKYANCTCTVFLYVAVPTEKKFDVWFSFQRDSWFPCIALIASFVLHPLDSARSNWNKSEGQLNARDKPCSACKWSGALCLSALLFCYA